MLLITPTPPSTNKCTFTVQTYNMGPRTNKRGAEEIEHAENILALPIDASALFTVDQFVQREDDETSADQSTLQNVYVVRPQNLWQALIPKRFSRFECEKGCLVCKTSFANSAQTK